MTSILEVEQLDTLSSNASSTLTIGGTNTTTINLGASGKSIVIPSGATLTNNGTVTGIGGTNTPYWCARETSLQTINHNTETKATLQTEILDSDSAYDTGTSRFTVPTGQGGDYFVWFQIDLYDADSDITNLTGIIKKNGSTIISKVYTDFSNGSVPSHAHMYVSTMLTLSATDYIEYYILMTTSNGSTAQSYGAEFGTQAGGYKLIGA
jgi:hypothetical protein